MKLSNAYWALASHDQSQGVLERQASSCLSFILLMITIDQKAFDNHAWKCPAIWQSSVSFLKAASEHTHTRISGTRSVPTFKAGYKVVHGTLDTYHNTRFASRRSTTCALVIRYCKVVTQIAMSARVRTSQASPPTRERRASSSDEVTGSPTCAMRSLETTIAYKDLRYESWVVNTEKSAC